MRVRFGVRGAFTLIELLVVVGIILFLTTITVYFMPNFWTANKVSSAASQLQSWLLAAKSRALRDQFPRGIRVLPSGPPGNLVCKTLQFIEQPDDFSVGTIQVTNSAATGGTNVDFTGGFGGSDPSPYPVQMNDFLIVQGQLFRVFTNPVQGPPSTFGITPTAGSPIPATTNYKIVRSPRLLNAEGNLRLPQDVVIDLNTGKSQIPADGNNNDILFGPSGALVRAGASVGKVIFWLRDPTRDTNDPGQQIAVVVYSRTGTITVYAVNTDNPSDPFSFTRDGGPSGL
jgi:type II secretory pathway pseudopilin PulG